MNYNTVLKYIIENLSDYREEIESTLSYIYKYRMSFQQADRGGKLEDTIMAAISDYEVDNDYERDEILDQLLSEYDLEDLFFDAIDKMDRNVNENYKLNEAKYYIDDRGYEHLIDLERYPQYSEISSEDFSFLVDYKLNDAIISDTIDELNADIRNINNDKVKEFARKLLKEELQNKEQFKNRMDNIIAKHGKELVVSVIKNYSSLASN